MRIDVKEEACADMSASKADEGFLLGFQGWIGILLLGRRI